METKVYFSTVSVSLRTVFIFYTVSSFFLRGLSTSAGSLLRWVIRGTCGFYTIPPLKNPPNSPSKLHVTRQINTEVQRIIQLSDEEYKSIPNPGTFWHVEEPVVDAHQEKEDGGGCVKNEITQTDIEGSTCQAFLHVRQLTPMML